MADLYNTILEAYTAGFPSLSPKAKFHFASRLYLWNKEPRTEGWLQDLRPWFTADNNPRQAVLELVKAAPPPMKQTASIRRRYFDRFPALQSATRALFRLNFMTVIYDCGESDIFYEVLDETSAAELRRRLLADDEAMIGLSSFALNYIYLYDGLMQSTETPGGQLLELARSGFDSSDRLERQLQLYFYTHCLIGQSLFYRRQVEATDTYLAMQHDTETLIEHHFDDIKLDNMFEHLVGCRLLGRRSRLEDRILSKAEANLTVESFIAEPLDKRPQNLGTAEHRNVLFLMSQQPFRA